MGVTIKPGQVVLDPGQPQKWIYEEGSVLADLERRMMRVRDGARAQVGRRTDRLARSIRMRSNASPRSVYVDVEAGGSGIDYTMAHHDGTRPHVIRAKRARAMRFEWRGRIVFATKVNHPGTRPNRFLTDNLYRAAG